MACDLGENASLQSWRQKQWAKDLVVSEGQNLWNFDFEGEGGGQKDGETEWEAYACMGIRGQRREFFSFFLCFFNLFYFLFFLIYIQIG